MKINLSKDDLQTISLALFEYAGICDSEADLCYGSFVMPLAEGFIYKQDKKAPGYKLAKKLMRIHDKLEKEMRKHNE